MTRSTWGSITTKSRDVHVIRYTVGGTRRVKTVRGTRKEAERELATLRVKYEGVRTADMTLEQFWSLYYLPEISRELAKSSVAGYVGNWEHDIKPAFGDVPLASITPRMVQDWLSGMTRGSAKHAKSVLSAMLSRALALGMVDDNVAQRRYSMPKESAPGRSRTRDVYNEAELVEIFEQCEGEPWEAAFILAAFGGASREEAMSPMVGEVEEREGCALVPVVRGVQRLGGEVVVVDKPKNRYREDVLVVPPPYAARLLAIQDEARGRGDTWLTDDGFGSPMCPNNMATAYKRWFLGRPMRYVPFANLRNSYATYMHAKGLDGLFVSKLMRHAQPTTTYKHYDRPSAEDKIKALAAAGIC